MMARGDRGRKINVFQWIHAFFPWRKVRKIIQELILIPFDPVCHFSENQLPALVGQCDVENWINAKSWQKEILRPSDHTDSTYFDGTWNLQNRWENYVFPAYGPSLEALFAIM